MTRHLATLLAILAACTSFVSCNSDKKKATAQGASISAPYELLVVANKDWMKSGNSEALREITEAKIPCLPQSENCFRVTSVNPSSFNRSFMFYANILVAEVSPKYAKAECTVGHDVYAHPQIIVRLTAPDQASFDNLCAANREHILELFNQAELQRECRQLGKRFSPVVARQARQQFGCSLLAPKEINAVKQGKDFFWASSQDTEENYLNICMYAYPYDSPETFTEAYCLAKRDSFMRQNIRGAQEGQYMSTDRRVVQTRDITVSGHYAQEVRGLWQMENAPMGGPFVSYSQIDSANRRVLVVEGFVFAPGKDKRKFIRQLEASLQTLKMPQRPR